MDDNLDYCCPQTGEALELINNEYISKNNVVYKIKNIIPWFCDEESYVDNFGMQWNKFAKTQLDSYSGSNLSEKRFFGKTNWEQISLEKLNASEVG